IDGSFVIGAAVFSRLVTIGMSPLIAFIAALASGALAGVLAASIQRGGKVGPPLSGVLATFVLSSVNLIIMGKPNINLLSQTTLVSFAFNQSELLGWAFVAVCTVSLCLLVFGLLKSKFGLLLRAFGDNPNLLKRLGKNIEHYRLY